MPDPIVHAYPFYEAVFIATWWTVVLCVYIAAKLTVYGINQARSQDNGS